jgi:hypothetical protein
VLLDGKEVLVARLVLEYINSLLVDLGEAAELSILGSDTHNCSNFLGQVIDSGVDEVFILDDGLSSDCTK